MASPPHKFLFLSMKSCRILAPLGALLIFLKLAAHQLHLPGPHYDEAVEIIPAMQLLLGQPVEAFRGAGIWLGGRLFPIMVVDYIGALNTYLTLPLFAALDVSVFAMRLMPIFVALVTLALTYRLGRELADERVALAALYLLAVNPSFVFWSRQGIFVTSITAPILLALVLCWLRWHQGRGNRYLYAAAFLGGLGLYAKFLFLWGIVALGASHLLLTRREGLLRLAREMRQPWLLLTLFLCFLAGIWPLILFNIQTGGTIATFMGNALSSYYGVNNLAFWANLRARLEGFTALVEGSHFWYLGGAFANRLYPLYLAASLVLAVIPRRRTDKGTASLSLRLLPFLMLALVILQSCFTISALWITHYALIVPLIPLAVAVGWMRWDKRVAAMALLLLGAFDVNVDLHYHIALAHTGGHSAHSDAIYDLSGYLLIANQRQPLAMDWGIKAPVQLLTKGRINPLEVFGYEWEADEAFKERIKPFFSDPAKLYIFRSPEDAVFKRWEAFQEAVEEEGKKAVLKATIRERSGRPLFLVYEVKGGP